MTFKKKKKNLFIIEFWLEEIIFILLNPSIIDKKMGISFKNEDKNENIQIFLIIFSYQSMYFNNVKLHESDCKLFSEVRKVFVQLEIMWEVNVISVNL